MLAVTTSDRSGSTLVGVRHPQQRPRPGPCPFAAEPGGCADHL